MLALGNLKHQWDVFFFQRLFKTAATIKGLSFIVIVATLSMNIQKLPHWVNTVFLLSLKLSQRRQRSFRWCFCQCRQSVVRLYHIFSVLIHISVVLITLTNEIAVLTNEINQIIKIFNFLKSVIPIVNIRNIVQMVPHTS